MLSSSRLTRLTDLAIRLHEAEDAQCLGQIAAEALQELIPCDWPLVTLAISHFPFVRHCFSTSRAEWQAYADRVLQFSHEDPVYTSRLRLLLERPASPTEFVDRNSLERTELFSDVWRPLGARSILRCLTPGRYNYRLEVGRDRAREFDADDILVMQTVARHLDAATDHLVRRNGQRIPFAGSLQPVQRFSWLVCDLSGRILRSTDRARAIMQECVGSQPADIPPDWLAELRRRAAGHAPRPLWYAVGSCPVSVHIAPIRPTTNEFSVGFLERPNTGDPTDQLVALGLTRREAQVLRWVAEGKSNAETGVLLGISALTVKKHLENIFGKLGVENRTTAVVVALESMRNPSAN